MQQLILELTNQFNVTEEIATGIISSFAVFAEEQYPSLGNSLTRFLYYEKSELPVQDMGAKQMAAA